jgi:hypothetical protein
MASMQDPPIQAKDERFTVTESLPGRDRRVHIIGAGPVGLLLTALLQPMDGLSVHLYEKRREYTRTRMVQLSSYLVADSVESYSADHIDGDNVLAVFDPPELDQGLAFRQAIPPDLIASARPPDSSIMRAVSWLSCSDTSVTTTLAPSRANASAVARPMPPAAPVTTKATFPLKVPF